MAAVTGLALAARFLLLGAEGLWADEAASWLLTRSDVGRLMEYLRQDVHPPLYYLAVWAWTRMGGAGEWSLRFVSAAAGTVSVPLLFWAGRQVPVPEEARGGEVWAAVFLALSPFHIHYSQEAKSYALMLALSLLGAGALLKAAGRRGGPGWALLWVVAGTGALYTHPTAAFLLPPLAVAAVIARGEGAWARRSAWAGVALLPGALVLPWFAASSRAVSNVSGALAWAEPVYRAQVPWQPALSWTAFCPAAAAPERNLMQIWVAWEEPFRLGAAGALWLGLGTGLCLLLWGRFAARAPRAFALLLVLALGPLLLLLALSPFRLVYLVGRTDALALPFFLLGCGFGAAVLTDRLRTDALRRPFAVRGALVLSLWVVLAVPSLVSHYTADYRSGDRILFRAVAAAAEPGDLVVVTGESLSTALYYLKGPGAAGGEGVGVEVRVFPAELARHPAWEDPSAYDPAALSAEAGALAAQTRGRRVMTVRRASMSGLALEAALARVRGPEALRVNVAGEDVLVFAADGPSPAGGSVPLPQ